MSAPASSLQQRLRELALRQRSNLLSQVWICSCLISAGIMSIYFMGVFSLNILARFDDPLDLWIAGAAGLLLMLLIRGLMLAWIARREQLDRRLIAGSPALSAIMSGMHHYAGSMETTVPSAPDASAAADSIEHLQRSAAQLNRLLPELSAVSSLRQLFSPGMLAGLLLCGLLIWLDLSRAGQRLNNLMPNLQVLIYLSLINCLSLSQLLPFRSGIWRYLLPEEVERRLRE